MKNKTTRPSKVKFDRGMNPHDGSRRRLSSTTHKSKKHYTRKHKHKGSAFSLCPALRNAA